MVRSEPLEPTLPGMTPAPCDYCLNRQRHRPATWKLTDRVRKRGPGGHPVWGTKVWKLCDEHKATLEGERRAG